MYGNLQEAVLRDSLTPDRLEAGCDEAGRGCLAGPVVAAAVIWPRGLAHPKLNDSKQLKKSLREELDLYIREHAVCWAVASVDNTEIDRINILNASYRAMNEAVNKLVKKPELLLIDGNRFCGHPGIPHECIVKGDGKYLSIAAASILAKVHRDRLMGKLGQKYPGYGWERNAGYGTPQHREALESRGITPLHRRSFLRKMKQLDLFQSE